MRQRSTLVGIFFLFAALVVGYVVHLAVASVFGVARLENTPILGDRFPLSALIGTLVGGATAAVGFLWEKPRKFVEDVSSELDKVNWPSANETKTNTLVVIVTSVIAALILGVFDATFAQLSTWLAETKFHF